MTRCIWRRPSACRFCSHPVDCAPSSAPNGQMGDQFSTESPLYLVVHHTLSSTWSKSPKDTSTGIPPQSPICLPHAHVPVHLPDAGPANLQPALDAAFSPMLDLHSSLYNCSALDAERRTRSLHLAWYTLAVHVPNYSHLFPLFSSLSLPPFLHLALSLSDS